MDSFFSWFGFPGTVMLTLLMSVLALVLAICRPTPTRWVCFGAMGLSSIGDVFLARFNGLDILFPNYFAIGAGFFMAAHFLYILCYRMKLRAANAPFWNVGSITAIALGAVTSVVLAVLCLSRGTANTLPLVALYAVIIFANCATVFSYAWSKRLRSLPAILAVVGVISFLLSDLIIGLGIAGNIHTYDNLIWWFYPIGQFFMILCA